MGDRRDDGRFDDTVLRATGALCLFGVALIHFLDFFAKLSETPYLAALYGVLMAVTVGAGLTLVLNGARAAWYVGGVAAALTIGAYVLSRTTGLPSATGDIGNWHEPLGQASLFVEGAVVVLSASALAIGATARRSVAAPATRRIKETSTTRSSMTA
jgi:hypothetical protein